MSAELMSTDTFANHHRTASHHINILDIDDEDDHDAVDESDQDPSVIGVAFNRQQKRLTLPSTPAAEKVAALRRGGEGGFFDRKAGRKLTTHDASGDESRPRSSLEKNEGAVVRAVEKRTPTQQPGTVLQAQIDGAELLKSSKSQLDKVRAWTGLSDAREGQSKRHAKVFQLPPLPRFSQFAAPQVGTKLPWSVDAVKEDEGYNSTGYSSRVNSQQDTSAASSFDSESSVAPSSRNLNNPKDGDHESRSYTASQLVRQESQQRQSRPAFYSELTRFAKRRSSSSDLGPRQSRTSISERPLSHRSTSDNDLQRALSITSSLGDDARWVDVHAQINARMKALKDSFIDSNMKFPRFPSLSALNFGAPWHHHEPSERRKSKQYWEEQWDTRRASDPRKGSTGELPRVSTEFPPTLPQDPSLSSAPPPGMTKTNSAKHPHFVQAVKHLTGDVVILGGYRGSILRSAEPGHRQLWVPIKVGLNLRKVNLEVGLNREDEENMKDTVIPGGMLSHIGPVDISRRLFKRLRASRNATEGTLRVWNYGYDWRLSPHRLSQELIKFLEGLPCNAPGTPPHQRGALVMAHSLGGLITRHAVNTRAELFSGVLYVGVPQRCVNILGPMRNGDDVLFSSRVLTAQVNFSIRTSFALLPLDGSCFINRDTKERYDVDFFDPHTWDEYRLSPCVTRPIIPTVPPTPTLKSSIFGALPSMVRPGSSSKSSLKQRSSGTNTPVRSGSPPPKSETSSTSTSTSTPSPARHIASTIESAFEPDAMTPQMGHNNNDKNTSPETNVATAVTLSKDEALAYLGRILPEIKRFKQQLVADPALAKRGLYPPAGVIYGKSVPTVYGAHVRSREAIKYADAYDDLAFASGDGVVLATAAQIPEGFEVAKGARVSSERGHLSLLGDLEAVGRCLNGIMAERDRRRRGEGGGGLVSL